MTAADGHECARLVFPALRWRPRTGYRHEADVIDRALRHGVGGFIVFGGTAYAVRELTAELRRRSSVPLLIGADLERGAGQQFAGATPLPPHAALGHLDDIDATRAAAALTAREALALGVDWIYAPVADLDNEAANPIVGTRAFGADPARVARHVGAWIEACRAAGALACAKHFPGHGRATEDSHATLPRVPASRAALEADLAPFRAAIAASVDSMMSAHVVFDAFDDERPATLSPRLLGELLRDELGFDGIVVSDALNMKGVLASAGAEPAAAVAAVAAGCDAVLYPDDPDGVVSGLIAAFGRALPAARVREAIGRLDAAIDRLRNHAPAAPRAVGAAADVEWARALAVRSIVTVRGVAAITAPCDVLTVDDDVGGPYPPPPRTALLDRLRGLGVDARPVAEPARGGRTLIVALYADIRAWKRRRGVSSDALRRVEATLAACPDTTILLFGHPALADELSAGSVIAAWGGEPLMQEAVADWIVAQPPCLPRP